MRQRTSIILAVVAAVMAGFIYLYERNLPTTAELEEREDRLIPGFDRDRVDRIVLGSGEERVELARDSAEPDAGPLGSVGSWRLTHPRELDADPEAVDELLNAIDWLERRRTVNEPGALEEERYGLEEPRGRVALRLRGRDIALIVGGDAPGEAIYVALEGETDTVYAVDHEFLEQISKGVGDLRNRNFAEIRMREVQAIRVKGRFHAVRASSNRWNLRTPVEMRADAGAVEDIVRDLERLRVSRFVADDVNDEGLSEYGLNEPSREVSLRLADEEGPLVLLFGGECEGHAGEVYATVQGSGTIACIEAEVVGEQLGVEPNSLREMRATRLGEDLLESITVAQGSRSLTIRRIGARWRLPAVESGEADAGAAEGPEADGDSVEALVNALRDLRGEEVTDELEAVGLAGDEPDSDVRIRLVPEDGGEAETLYFAISEGALYLRRGAEVVALRVPGELPATISADPLGFRDRRVVDETSGEANELRLVVGNDEQLLRKREGIWRMVSPAEFRGDQVGVREIVRSLSRLEAVRFVDDAPQPEHGLESPYLSLRLQSTPDEDADGGAGGEWSSTLLVGDETDGGRFARLEGSDTTVFVVSDDFVSILESPLLDRDLFAVEEERVDRLTIERGAERHEIELVDDEWREDGEAVPPRDMDRILARLGGARAIRVVGFGDPLPTMSLDPPRARVTIRLTEAEGEGLEEVVLLIGAEVETAESPGVYVRREDLDATFELPLRTIEPLLFFGAIAEPVEPAADAAPDLPEDGE